MLAIDAAPAPDRDRYVKGAISYEAFVASGKRELAMAIEREVDYGPVAVALDWSEGPQPEDAANHEVVVVKMDANSVTLHNPQGYLDQMTRAEFERRLANASLPAPQGSG